MSRLPVLLLVMCASLVVGKIYDKCDLADELERKHGVSKEDVKKWVCIAQYESTFNTKAHNKQNSDGSQDYGLFQLNNKYWCGNTHKNECNMPCEALLDEDITDDVRCMKKIIRETEKWKGKGTGLTAWVAYVNRCKDRNLDEYMADCPNYSGISNLLPVRQVSAGDSPPRTENIQEDSEPIINSARVPIRPKVISNMHPIYIPVPMYSPYMLPRPSRFFYQRN
ncbi:lysozyme C-like isoform X1 [Portunus trituberculatus]|uniref:lysozyme C-like isoform X1 n=1 Tax=Portunus trituberculatus TaxID=210409 RepID=UPI001E1CE1FE|nr:lysozyme C-like isoform X1 [Portunus trituberculatus]